MTVAVRNVHAMHFLERICAAMNQAGVPVMLLKGAALQLCLYEQPDDRPMSDLDLLVHPDDLRQAMAVLQSLGGYRSAIVANDAFFPRYYFEAEYNIGQIVPVAIDLHVRPIYPLRYTQLMPDDALWAASVGTELGQAKIHIPNDWAMLLHLCAHYAIHGGRGRIWARDIALWIQRYSETLDWQALVETADRWHLSYAVHLGLHQAQLAMQGEFGTFNVPMWAWLGLCRGRTSWRDQLAIRQAPFDHVAPIRHVLIAAITTPNLRYVAGYLRAMMLPGKSVMRQWYGREHFAWLPVAYAWRTIRPVFKPVLALSRLRRCYRIEDDQRHRSVVARRSIMPGQTIATFTTRTCDGDPRHLIHVPQADGSYAKLTIDGPMKHLAVSDTPNCRCVGYQVVANCTIFKGQPLTIGPQRIMDAAWSASPQSVTVDAATPFAAPEQATRPAA